MTCYKINSNSSCQMTFVSLSRLAIPPPRCLHKFVSVSVSDRCRYLSKYFSDFCGFRVWYDPLGLIIYTSEPIVIRSDVTGITSEKRNTQTLTTWVHYIVGSRVTFLVTFS
jgi:hypothetical protein